MRYLPVREERRRESRLAEGVPGRVGVAATYNVSVTLTVNNQRVGGELFRYFRVPVLGAERRAELWLLGGLLVRNVYWPFLKPYSGKYSLGSSFQTIINFGKWQFSFERFCSVPSFCFRTTF